MSVIELLYGAPLALPGDLLDTTEPPAASFLENLQRSPSSIPTRPLIGPPLAVDPPSHLTSADFVLLGEEHMGRHSRRYMMACTV